MMAMPNRHRLTLAVSVVALSLSTTVPVQTNVGYAALAQAAPSTWSQGVGTSIDGKTNVERAIGKCVGSVIGGALLGALVGAAAGSAKKGALVGTAVGVGVCAIVMKVASKKDKMVLRDAQLQAANLGYMRNANWTGEQGSQLAVAVTPSAPVPLVVGAKGSFRCRTDNRCLVGDTWVPYETLAGNEPAPGVKQVAFQPKVYKCRRLNTKLTVDGSDASPGSEAVCLVGDTWVTGDKLKKLKIRDADVVTI